MEDPMLVLLDQQDCFKEEVGSFMILGLGLVVLWCMELIISHPHDDLSSSSAAATLYPFDACIGIELLEGLYNASLLVVDSYNSKVCFSSLAPHDHFSREDQL